MQSRGDKILPMATSISADPISILKDLLRIHPDVCFVNFQWLDYAGVLRAKVLVVEACFTTLADGKLVRLPPMALHCAADSTLLTGTDYPGVHYLVPDWATLKSSAHPSTVTVMCGVSTKTSLFSPCMSEDLCPRRALGRVIKQAAEQWRLDFLVGFEVEFQVMRLSERREDGLIALSSGLGHFATSGMLDPCWPVVEECVRQLRGLGVLVCSLHTEGLAGQYEIALAPLPPLQAVDQLVLVRSVLKETFHRHGSVVTMAPKPLATGQQQLNGQHMHISFRENSSGHEQSFLAGMLGRLPQLWAFLLPQRDSYDRVAPWMAGDHVAWGTENRTVPIRQIESNHWEMRSMDSTANVYLALAAALGAGLCGIAGDEPLTWPDVTFEGLTAQGVSLPRSLAESLSVLCDNHAGLDAVLGDAVIRHYVSLKRYELSQFEKMSSEQARDLLVRMF